VNINISRSIKLYAQLKARVWIWWPWCISIQTYYSAFWGVDALLHWWHYL